MDQWCSAQPAVLYTWNALSPVSAESVLIVVYHMLSDVVWVMLMWRLRWRALLWFGARLVTSSHVGANDGSHLSPQLCDKVSVRLRAAAWQ